ncbi:MAG: hypothetical protein FWE84_04125 [Firmicutes bacterium]|nr:hypothetical protein [Bacillota bacterium]
MRSKVESLIGFAVKARKVVYGADFIENKKGISLIIYSADLAENSSNKLKKVAQTAKIPLVVTHLALENIVCKQGVKAIAITDRQMVRAIVDNINNTDGFNIVEIDGANAVNRKNSENH